MPKVTAIEEAKNLSILSLEGLMGSLISHEAVLKNSEPEEENKSSKNLAFNASEKNSNSDDETDIDEELALMTKKFRQFLKNKRYLAQNRIGGSSSSSSRFKTQGRSKREDDKTVDEKDHITCFKCGRPGHMRSDCPNRGHSREKAMMVTWSDSNSEEEDQAYMARTESSEDDETSTKVTTDPSYCFTKEEAVTAYLSLVTYVQKLKDKNLQLEHRLEK
ncbi:hypothetical protein LINPERHAP2_LOCUS19592 [Linum perenne]